MSVGGWRATAIAVAIGCLISSCGAGSSDRASPAEATPSGGARSTTDELPQDSDVTSKVNGGRAVHIIGEATDPGLPCAQLAEPVGSVLDSANVSFDGVLGQYLDRTEANDLVVQSDSIVDFANVGVLCDFYFSDNGAFELMADGAKVVWLAVVGPGDAGILFDQLDDCHGSGGDQDVELFQGQPFVRMKGLSDLGAVHCPGSVSLACGGNGQICFALPDGRLLWVRPTWLGDRIHGDADVESTLIDLLHAAIGALG